MLDSCSARAAPREGEGALLARSSALWRAAATAREAAAERASPRRERRARGAARARGTGAVGCGPPPLLARRGPKGSLAAQVYQLASELCERSCDSPGVA